MIHPDSGRQNEPADGIVLSSKSRGNRRTAVAWSSH